MKKSILYLGMASLLCVVCVYAEAAGSQSANHQHGGGATGEGVSDEQRQRLGAQLIAFAKSGDVSNVQRLLQAGAPLDCVDESIGKTAFGWATYYGHEAVTQALLVGGADIDAVSIGEARPLHAAIREGHAGVVRLLLGAGAHIDNQQVWDQLRRDYEVRYYGEVIRVLSACGVAPLTDQQDASCIFDELQVKRNQAQLQNISKKASLERKAAIEVSLGAVQSLPRDLQRLIMSMSESEAVVQWWKQHDQKREAQSREGERPHKRRKREVS